MTRTIYFSFFDFDQHIDLSKYDNGNVTIELTRKGGLTPNGKNYFPKNVSTINYFGLDLPDPYDERIEALINAIGGRAALEEIINLYNAKDNCVVLGIPRNSDYFEDGFISSDYLQLFCELNIEVHFYLTQ